MNGDSFWIASAGFLLAFQPGPDLRTPRWSALLGRCFLESVELFVHMIFLLGFYGQILLKYPESPLSECFPLYYALGAYVLKVLRKKEGTFLAVSLLLGLSFSSGDLGTRETLFRLLRLVSGSGFSALLLLCAQRKLVFSRQPAAFQGLPQAFLLAAFLCLALHSLEGFFCF